jgi:hypothetical protein
VSASSGGKICVAWGISGSGKEGEGGGARGDFIDALGVEEGVRFRAEEVHRTDGGEAVRGKGSSPRRKTI